MDSSSSSSSSALAQLELGEALGADVVPMANDLARVLSIQLAIQLMMVLSDESGATTFFSVGFMTMVLYVTLGVMFYWLALRKLFVFV